MNNTKSIKSSLGLFIVMLFSIIILFSFSQQSYAAEEVASGTCGDNLTWVLDDDGLLTISGSGAMDDFAWDSQPAPWKSYASSIKTVMINNGVTQTGQCAFYDCDRLANVLLPDSLTSIKKATFYGCSRLTSISLPEGLEIIESLAFRSCISLTSITIPDSITEISSDAFSDCRNLSKVYVNQLSTILDNGLGSISGSSNSGVNLYIDNELAREIVIPTGTKIIGRQMLYACNSVTSIILPDSTIEIMDNAFARCINLKKINIPQSVTKVGASAFRGCSSLDSITLPDTLESIEETVFAECSNLSSVTIPKNVKKIEYGAFQGCHSLGSISIPESVIDIGEWAFYDCINLSSIILPKDIICIRADTFRKCSNLESVKIPDGLTSIEFMAFQYCTSLKSIVLPNSITNIANQAFEYCPLTDVYYIGNQDEWNCVIISDGNDILGEAELHFLCKPEEHIWNTDYSIDKSATCSADGLKSIHCAICGSADESTIKVIPALGHDWDVGEITKEPSCIEAGVKTFSCTRCKETRIEVVAALGHSFSDKFAVDIEPTCTMEGSKSKHCAKCNEVTEVTPIDALGHDWDSGTITTEPTCTDKGVKTFNCSRCEETKTEAVDALGHKPSDPVKENEVEATCEKDGSYDKVVYCSACKDELSRDKKTVAALGHNWNEEYTTDKEASCTEKGSRSIHCSRCNEIDESTVEVIPKLDHTYGDWKVTKEATCVKDGSKEKVCSVCNDKVIEEVAALGHDWNSEPTVDKEATCTEVGVQSIHCARCNETQEASIIPPLGHKWNTTYTVDVPATESAAGSKSIHCSVCGAIKEGSSETIPKLTPSTPTGPTEIVVLPTVKISKPKAAKKKVTVRWKKVSKKNQKRIKGIEIQVATDKNFKNIVKTTTAGKKKTSKVIKGLKSKTKYYVRIRAYAAGNHVSQWKSKSVKVK